MKLVGPRIVVRPPRVSDIPAILRYLRENRAPFRPYEPERPSEYYTAPHWRWRIRHRDPTALRLMIFDGAEVVGAVNLSNIARGAFQSCSIGYMLAKRHEGRGLMTEALRLVIAYAFGSMNLHRIMANYLPTNVRSAKLLRRLGFATEGRARAYLHINGRWRDHVLTSLVNPNWRAR